MKIDINFLKDLYFEMLELKAKARVVKTRNGHLVRMDYPKHIMKKWNIGSWHYVDVEEFEEFFKKYATNKR